MALGRCSIARVFGFIYAVQHWFSMREKPPFAVQNTADRLILPNLRILSQQYRPRIRLKPSIIAHRGTMNGFNGSHRTAGPISSSADP